jgi:transposase
MAALRSSLRSALRHRSTISQQHRTTRHRLNRGGDRHVNYALHIIALVRLSSINRPATTPLDGSQGMSNLETIRCLKRYIAREIHHVLTVDEA